MFLVTPAYAAFMKVDATELYVFQAYLCRSRATHVLIPDWLTPSVTEPSHAQD